MGVQTLDAGKANHSPSAEFMELVDVDHMNDFDTVKEYLVLHLDDIIREVHGFDKLLVDNGKTQLNCPPAPEAGDSHGNLLLRTLSEKESNVGGITLKREFKVHNLGLQHDTVYQIEIREDVIQAPNEVGNPPVCTENRVVVEIDRRAA